MGPRKQVRAAESRRTIGRGMWAFLFGIFASFGVGFWLMSATLALARFFVYSDPPGVGDASRLRRIYVTRSGSAPYQVMPVLSASEVSSLRTALGDLRVEAYSERVSRLELGNLRQSVRSVEATAGLLSLLHVRLQLGNNDPAESDDQPYAVISDRLWRQAFQGSTSALGTAIRIDGRPYRVSGILPAGFDGL
ncbi:MAG TPA: ABC transporter permease, partial [Gemmatimonadaceae bacterium]|nr:ABC transporter permease [Gemmatimonadaceae bacterium]